MKNIVILGDSFTFGEGCSDVPITISATKHRDKPSEFCWPALLKKEFPNDNIINLSVPGNSLAGMFRDISLLRKNVPQIKIDFIIASVTSYDRIVIADHLDPEYEIKNWVLSNLDQPIFKEPQEYMDAKVGYVKYLINQQVLDLNGMMDLLSIIHYCRHLIGAPILCSLPDPHIILKQPGYYDPVKSILFHHMYDFEYMENHKSMDDKTKEELTKKFRAEDGHPNDKGHQHYFENYIVPMVVPKIKQFMNYEKFEDK